MEIREKVIKTEELLKGNIFNVRRDHVLLPNGKTATRDDLDHDGASAIFALTDANEVILVQQFRCSVYDITTELPTGKLEYGEDPKDAAIRELEEETGYRAKYFEHFMDIYSAVGYCNEVLHIYLAKDLYETSQNLDEDEFLNVIKVDIKTLKEDILNNKYKDSKLICAVLKYCTENNI
ncbi:NUDIX hydrolase [Anaerofustis sp.]|uniref:NUDIX hydrolase n=1 Tax=Anaerofustis sp. TaxID=1872517 RepID=UPI0025BD5914|nr:NUDIX hydrolase [Anaerofustis sp.]